jgi:hypothetical protein
LNNTPSGGKVREVYLQRTLAVLIVVVSCLGAAAAQVFTPKKVGGETVMCMRTGLISDLNDCGFHSDWYAYVFVGSISAITPAGNNEQNIQITPEEVFHGEPLTPLTVMTSQGACLPEMVVGDRWLFSLRKKTGEPIVLDYFANDSRPVADALEQIETLRRLENIGDRAIVHGHVVRTWTIDEKAVAGAHVVARRASDHLRFTTTTGADARYEFQPLPPGEYELNLDDRNGSFRPHKRKIDVGRGACWDLTLSQK